MGAITGRPTRDELLENLENYRSAGIDQFMIYARSGLEVEYMGPEWLEICRVIIEYCATHNMAVWLYDEYNWPSGKCKGKVVKSNPDFAAKKLVAFPERNFCGVENPDAPAPEYFWTEMSIPIYADLLNPDSVDCFINLTHEVYYRNFGEYFGSTVKGIFTDEPSFIYPRFQNVSGSALELPFYNGLKEDYHQRSGRDLIDDLEADLHKKNPKELWENIFKLLGDRFRTVYMDRIRQWCTDHEILFTGHLMHESHPQSAILANGDPVNAMRAFSMPGIDEISSRTNFNDIEWNTFKLLESAMHGKRTEALAELFALGPADMTPAKMRQMIYLAALHGVNHFVLAVSALDARGNVEKSLYYNPMAPTQPWFRYIAELNDSAAIAASLTRKASSTFIALRYPQGLSSRNWRGESKPPVDYSALIRALINAQWEFRLIDEDDSSLPYKAVFSLSENGATDELSNLHFNSIDEILTFLDNTLTRRFCLFDEKSCLISGVLLKSYDDGSACVVNTSGAQLRGRTSGGEFFEMPPHDVALFPRQLTASRRILDISNVRFYASLENLNSRRCIFDQDGNFTIELKSDVEVKVALRDYCGKVELELDGTLVSADKLGHDMPFGFKQLYRESSSFILRSGRHLLRLKSHAKDLPYLPSALLFGSFSLGCDRVIRNLPKTLDSVAAFFTANLTEYAGTVIFSANVDLSEYEALSFEFKGMAVELLLDGQSQKSRLWAPFIWEVPETYRRNDVKVELRIATSIGPLFGDYPEHQAVETKNRLDPWWPGARCL